MTIEPTQRDSLPFPWFRFFRPSHRTPGEQMLGFGIYFLICLGLGLTNQVPLTLTWISYFSLLSLSAWSLWRRYSLRILKLEISLFFTQFIFQIGWALNFYLFNSPLLALAALLILLCNQVIAMLLFWKKEPLSAQFLLLPFLWAFYQMCINMTICISNP